MSTKAKPLDISDFMPAPDVEDDIGAVDLNFGFGADDEDEDEGVGSKGTDSEDSDEDEDADATGDEGEGEDEGAKARKDKDGKSDADADKKAGKDKAEKAKKHMVPKSRLDKVLERNRELEAELAARSAASAKPEKKDGDKAPAKYDFDKAEEDYQDAVLDGRKADAARIRREMRAAERAEIQAELDATSSTTNRQQDITVTISRATAEIEKNFPMLDSNHADYNEEAATDLIDIYTGLVASGKDPMKALDKALNMVVKSHDLVGGDDSDDGEDPPADKKKDLKSKIDAAKKQPAKMPNKQNPSKKAKDPDEIDINTISDEDWDALPQSVKDRMMGNVL